jgi:hypothetical protein
MAVNEIGRQTTHLLGSSPEFTRTFEITRNSPITTSIAVVLCGCPLGSAHPEYFFAKCFSIELEESVNDSQDPDDPYLIYRVVAKYKSEEQENTDALPWLRPDSWKFQTQGVAVPALFYYDGQTQKPLTNSAGDYFEGLTVDEAQQKITITSNRLAFPSALAAAVTNCVNDGTYLGFAADCVKVQGISGEIATEVVNEQEVRYWKITSELLARQTGWNLLLPDVGFNFIDGGTQKRCKVEGPDGEQIASANPVALNGSGGRATGSPPLPAILNRRVYRQISMSQFFGAPPA